MVPAEAKMLKPGDKVHHRGMPAVTGTVVRVEGPFFVQVPDWVQKCGRFKIYWKGWNDDRDRVDYTWDYLMEKGHVPQQHSTKRTVVKDEPTVSPEYIANNYGRCRRVNCLCLEPANGGWKGTKCPAWVPVQARNLKDLEKELADDFVGTITVSRVVKDGASAGKP